MRNRVTWYKSEQSDWFGINYHIGILVYRECNLDVLAITEAHLSSKTEDHELAIINYDMEWFDREEKQDKGGGGCLIYFKQSLTVYTCSNRSNIAKETESAWIELTVKSQKFLIGAIYRPLDDENFFVNFSTILISIRHKRENIILLGGFNSDLLVKGGIEENPGNKMKRLIKCFDLKNIIKEPTRISRTATTLTDLIIVSDTDKVEIWISGASYFRSQANLSCPRDKKC